MTINLDDWGAVARAVFLWLPAVIALAWLAGRLLGIRMSWSRTIISGLIGAAAGGALAQILARQQHGAGFDRNLWLFTFVFTMSAVTWMALLSRPGALARAQTGLARLPRPLKAAKRKGQRVARYAQITRIAARHGLGPALGFGRSRADDDTGSIPTAVRVRRMLEDCGGIFVKLGQVASTRTDLLPPSAGAELAKLQDSVAPAEPAEIRALLDAELAGEFAERLTDELDFRIEERTAKEIARALPGESRVQIPRVYPSLTTARVLVLERFDGAAVSAAEWQSDLERKELADELLRVVMHQMLVDGLFHADPHPGNVLLLHSGDLGLIDFGDAGRLDPLQQAGLRDLFVAIGTRSPATLRQAVFEVAVPRGDADEDSDERALARFVAKYLSRGATPNAAMLNDLLQLCFTFELTLAPEMVTFFRALITLEGTLRVIAPGYLAIEAAQATAADLVRARAMEPEALQKIARDELLKALPTLRRLPNRMDRLLSQSERGLLRMRVSWLSDERDVAVLTRLLNRAVVAFLGGVVTIVSAWLMTSHAGPALTGEPRCFSSSATSGCSAALS
ncbi:MAG: ABC1 kinase family protein [Frankiaceae bacterium]